METTCMGTDDVKQSFEQVEPICRGCLTTNRRMTSSIFFGTLYSDLTGMNVSESDGLPQWLCYECIALLRKAVRFRHKLLAAHNILYQYLSRCAPFAIDAHDEELSKYASPHLVETNILSCDVGKRNNGACQVFEHEKRVHQTELDESLLPLLSKVDSNIKDETGFSDYEDNLTLEEFKATVTKVTEEDLESLLRDTDSVDTGEVESKKQRKTRKKSGKVKKSKTSEDDRVDIEADTKASIRQVVVLDPNKIRVITLNPEEQIKQREEEARTNLKFPFQCNLCYKGFNFEAKLANHMNKHSPSRGPFECKLCHMYLPTSYSFNVHNLIHTKRYECVDCGRRMIDRSSIIDHYRTQHEGLMKLFTCDLCGKVSNNNKTHRGHMRNHHGAERPKCDQCGKSFVNKDSLAEHLQIHLGIKNYSCAVCGQRFRTRTQVKHHQLKHSDAKDYYCVECDVRFKSAHNLRQHLQKSLKHKDSRSLIYACSSCSKRFEDARALHAHTRVQHEGVRAHGCGACGAALASAASLAKHLRTVHAGRRAPKRHVCHTCGKAFRGKSVLVNHLRTHTGEKPFECGVCARKFSQLTAMRTHVKLVHLKMRRQPRVKPELPTDQVPPPPKVQAVFKPEAAVETWRQPCDVFFQVTVGP